MFVTLLRIIATLKELLGTTNLDAVFSVLRLLLKMGMPPHPQDEKEFRRWMVTLGQAAEEAAKLTPNTQDDLLAKFCAHVAKDDQTWEIFYEVLGLVFTNREHEQITKDKITTLSEAIPGIGPAVVFTILNMILELIRYFRDNPRSPSEKPDPEMKSPSPSPSPRPIEQISPEEGLKSSPAINSGIQQSPS